MGKKINAFMNEFVAGLSGPANALSTSNGVQTITDAPISTELKDSLGTLGNLIAAAREKLNDSQRSRLIHDWEVLTSELSSDAPRRDWYTLSLRGVKESAADTGPLAQSILATVRDVADMLGVSV
jgi:hypothetical protein